MPKIQTRNLPVQLFRHLSEQAAACQISEEDLLAMADWLASSLTVPEGDWFKRFEGMILCGHGVLPKTFLVPGQAPFGEEVI